MHTLTQAQELILARVGTPASESVGLDDAPGRVLAADVCAPQDLPAWDNSAMDGYALDSASCVPGVLVDVVSYLPAGVVGSAGLKPGMAARILTGAPVPAGADCVVPQEWVEVLDGRIRVATPPVAGQHIRRRGSDVRTGAVVLQQGVRIGPGEIATLASLGLGTVAVTRQPRVAILSTGDELVDVGAVPPPGAIWDANAPALRAAVLDAGARPEGLPRAADEPGVLREQLARGLEADVLVTTAGVSVGDRDLVRETLRELGAQEVFWKVAIQPGRPAAFAVAGRCLVFSLPGNPVAALLTFELLVRPALRKLAGCRVPLPQARLAVLAEDVQPRADRLTLRRVRLTDTPDGLVATTAGPQATGFISTLSAADGVAFIPSGTALLPAGTRVGVHTLRADEEFLGRQ